MLLYNLCCKMKRPSSTMIVLRSLYAVSQRDEARLDEVASLIGELAVVIEL